MREICTLKYVPDEMCSYTVITNSQKLCDPPPTRLFIDQSKYRYRMLLSGLSLSRQSDVYKPTVVVTGVCLCAGDTHLLIGGGQAI